MRALFPPFLDTSNPLLARFSHVEALDSTDCTDVQAEMQAFFEMVVEQKCEGLMVKLLESGEGITGDDDEDEDDGAEGKKGKKKGNGGKKKPLPATYEPDQRSQGWLKVKKGESMRDGLRLTADYLEGLGDSLDLVPIGAWWTAASQSRTRAETDTQAKDRARPGERRRRSEVCGRSQNRAESLRPSSELWGSGSWHRRRWPGRLGRESCSLSR